MLFRGLKVIVFTVKDVHKHPNLEHTHFSQPTLTYLEIDHRPGDLEIFQKPENIKTKTNPTCRLGRVNTIYLFIKYFHAVSVTIDMST